MESNSMCGPCSRANISSLATKWCLHCEDPICDKCVDTHKRIKDLMNHHITNIGAKSLIPSSTMTSLKNCASHQDSAINFFCIKHDVLCCRRCIADNHRFCDDVLSLEEASRNVKTSSLLYNTSKDMKHILTTLQTFLQNRTHYRENVESQKQKIKASITELKQSMIKQLDEIEKSTLVNLDDLCQSVVAEQQKEELKATESSNAIEVFLKQVEFLTDIGSNHLLFSYLHHIQSKIKIQEDNLEDILSKPFAFEMTFQNNNILQGVTYMGSIERQKTTMGLQIGRSKQMEAQEVLSIKSKPIKSLKLEFHFDGELNSVTAIDVTKANNIVLADRSYLKIYTLHGKYIKQCELGGYSYGLACHKTSGRIVVSLREDGLQIIDDFVSQPVTLVANLTSYYGITFINDNIALAGQGKISILDFNAKHMKTITSETTGYIYCLHHYEQKLYFPDSITDNVYCIKEGGTDLQTMTISEIDSPEAVTTDIRGRLYVAGMNSNNIVRLSNDGKSSEVVLKDEDGIDNPRAICFSKDYKKLFVSSKNGSVVMAFKCEY